MATVVTARARLALALLGCLLCAPGVGTGLVLDDYLLAGRLRGADGSLRWRGLLDAFSFVPAGQLESARELGLVPWWIDPELKLSFFRPLVSLSHALDLQVLKQAPWLMHVESLLLLLALSLTVGRWYQRLFGNSPRVFSLAFGLYVFSPGHGFAASWLANRNSVLATLFGVLCLLAHDSCSKDSRRSALWSPLALAASLFSGELGLASLALLVAHAICLDTRPRRVRLRALLPALLVTVGWLVTYLALGYGTSGTSLYLDPLASPLGYLRALSTNLPILLFAQWVLPVASATVLLSKASVLLFAVVSLVCLALLAFAVIPLLRSDARARFCGLAALLALLPVAATIPHDRLLILSDIGGLGLLALTVDRALTSTGRFRLLFLVPFTVRAALVLLLLPASAGSLYQFIDVSKRPFEHKLREPAVAQQSLIFVNAPCGYFPSLLPALRRYEGGPVPWRIRTISPGIYPIELWRTDARTFMLRSERGLLQPLGTWNADGAEQVGAISSVYAAQALNQESRSERKFRVGERVSLSDLEVEITELTADGLPREVRFRFTAALDDASYRFLIWREREFEPFVIPALHEHVSIAATLR